MSIITRYIGSLNAMNFPQTKKANVCVDNGERNAVFMVNLYHAPVLSDHDFGLMRSPGPGLGNLLFPIGRALIGQANWGGTFVEPTIRQIKIGTFLRNEPDKRTYGRVFKHRGMHDWRARFTSSLTNSVSESDWTTDLQRGVTVKYSGLKNYFHDLSGYEGIIKEYLLARRRAPRISKKPYDIAVHIRLGDFAAYTPNAKSESMRQPMDWYDAALRLGCKTWSIADPKIVIFSDAPDDDDVKRFAESWSAEIDQSANALEAIMYLGQAKGLVASRSTFSMWGAFLSGCPAIWPEEFDLGTYWTIRPNLDSYLASV